MSGYIPLNDEQWASLETLFAGPRRARPGKPHAPWRVVLNSVLFVLLTGAKWSALPQDAAFASKSAANRWFIMWEKTGFLNEILGKLQMKVELPKRRTRSLIMG